MAKTLELPKELELGDLPSIPAVSEMAMEIKEISPAVACALLKRNTNNRALSKFRVKKLAAAMARGEWMVNGEAIKIDAQGWLRDGQHRLSAIVEYGKPVRMCVITGIPVDVMHTLDIGAKRSFADLLALKGCQDTNQLAATILALFEWDEGRLAARTATHVQLEATYAKHPGVHVALDYAKRMKPTRGVITSAGACGYVLTSEVNEVAAKLFAEGFISGANLKAGDPRLALAKYYFYFRKSGVRGTKETRGFHLWAYIKAWNYWCKGEELMMIKFLNGEQKPKLLAPRNR